MTQCIIMAPNIIINTQYIVMAPQENFQALGRISETLSALTFPNLTRSMRILPVSEDSPCRLKLQYRA